MREPVNRESGKKKQSERENIVSSEITGSWNIKCVRESERVRRMTKGEEGRK